MAGERSVYKPYMANKVKIYNSISRIKSIFGTDVRVGLDFDSLHLTAEEQTGLSDFGSSSYEEALIQLLESVRQEHGLHDFGVAMAKNMFLSSLKNRLYLEENIARVPGISTQSIKTPIWIVGLPRTGSTLLHNLLSLDKSTRTLKRWEALYPSSRNVDEISDRIARRKQAKIETDRLENLAPGILAKHSMGWNQPDECVTMFCDSFKSQLFGFCFGILPYVEWLRKQDLSDAYMYYKRQLQVLQWQQGGDRWVFKAPFHSCYMKEIEQTFENPLYIQLHRDPREVVPSVASLQSSIQGISSKSVDRNIVGKSVFEECRISVDSASEARKEISPDRIMDIQYKDMVKQPIETISSIYEKWGFDFSQKFQNAITSFMQANPKGKHGGHKYTCDEFGLSEGDFDSGFKYYIKQNSMR